ncbi:proline-rich protein HaeIII subfamily 1-like [Lutra lutra]|uniref:proline-rich protein HaeIII subfamily 1-like n=1 Tax=Lutra lutra TaxID=9657 RepID=UPI001FCFF50D|nr:proline-rich protein HaeIII subfamily 1-like [Lutra lutra]
MAFKPTAEQVHSPPAALPSGHPVLPQLPSPFRATAALEGGRAGRLCPRSCGRPPLGARRPRSAAPRSPETRGQKPRPAQAGNCITPGLPRSRFHRLLEGHVQPRALRKWPRPSLARTPSDVAGNPALASAGPPPPGSRRGPRGAALGPVPAPLRARRREEARLPDPRSGWDRSVWAADRAAPAVSASALGLEPRPCLWPVPTASALRHPAPGTRGPRAAFLCSVTSFCTCLCKGLSAFTEDVWTEPQGTQGVRYLGRGGKIIFSLPLEALGWELGHKRAAKEKHKFINTYTSWVPGRDPRERSPSPMWAGRKSGTTVP